MRQLIGTIAALDVPRLWFYASGLDSDQVLIKYKEHEQASGTTHQLDYEPLDLFYQLRTIH